AACWAARWSGLWQCGERICTPAGVGGGVPGEAAPPSPPGKAPVGGGSGMVCGKGASAMPSTLATQTGQVSGEPGSNPSGGEGGSQQCPRGQIRVVGGMAKVSGKWTDARLSHSATRKQASPRRVPNEGVPHGGPLLIAGGSEVCACLSCSRLWLPS